MATHTKTRIGQRHLGGLLKGSAVSHNRRAGQDAFPVTAQYTSVRTPSETKVISVYYQSLHLARGAVTRRSLKFQILSRRAATAGFRSGIAAGE